MTAAMGDDERKRTEDGERQDAAVDECAPTRHETFAGVEGRHAIEDAQRGARDCGLRHDVRAQRPLSPERHDRVSHEPTATLRGLVENPQHFVGEPLPEVARVQAK